MVEQGQVKGFRWVDIKTDFRKWKVGGCCVAPNCLGVEVETPDDLPDWWFDNNKIKAAEVRPAKVTSNWDCCKANDDPSKLTISPTSKKCNQSCIDKAPERAANSDVPLCC